MTYEEFLDSKKIVVHSMGIEIKDESINNTRSEERRVGKEC